MLLGLVPALVPDRTDSGEVGPEFFRKLMSLRELEMISMSEEVVLVVRSQSSAEFWLLAPLLLLLLFSLAASILINS